MVALVALSQIVASPGALERAGQSPAFFLARHAGRDWDELDPTDIAENDYSMAPSFGR
jgi:hypothetical protein